MSAHNNCEWRETPHGEAVMCRRCATIRAQPVVRQCPVLAARASRQSRPRQRCIHLGPRRGESPVKVGCGGCHSVHFAHECAIFGRCLPTFRGPWDADHQTEAALYHLCHGCDQKAFATPHQAADDRSSRTPPRSRGLGPASKKTTSQDRS